MILVMITGVNNNQRVPQVVGNSKKTGASKASENELLKEEKAAVLELGKSTELPASTYSKPAAKNSAKPDEGDKKKDQTGNVSSEEINRLWEEANKSTQHLRDMVRELLKSQGKTFNDVLSGKEALVIDEKTRAAAAEAISVDGECGVQAVSDRIVAFAKAISRDNPEMYDKLMSAIDEGFAQAEKALGGQLPDICRKTREEIGRKMEEWKNSNTSSSEKVEDNK